MVARVDRDRAVAGLDRQGVVALVDRGRTVARFDRQSVVALVDRDRAVAGLDRQRVVALFERDRAVVMDVDRLVAGRLLLLAHLQRRSEEHTSELQSLMRTSYAVFCLKKKTKAIYI